MKKNHIITRKLWTAIFVIAICTFLLAGCGNKTDAMEYVSVNFTGYNGNGTAKLDTQEDEHFVSTEEYIAKYQTRWQHYEEITS